MYSIEIGQRRFSDFCIKSIGCLRPLAIYSGIFCDKMYFDYKSNYQSF